MPVKSCEQQKQLLLSLLFLLLFFVVVVVAVVVYYMRVKRQHNPKMGKLFIFMSSTRAASLSLPLSPSFSLFLCAVCALCVYLFKCYFVLFYKIEL